jgi:hypothetical protein
MKIPNPRPIKSEKLAKAIFQATKKSTDKDKKDLWIDSKEKKYQSR